MRWKNKNKVGQKRIVSRFLFFPKCLDGEWRWLEKVWILQEVCSKDIGGNSGEWARNYRYYWVDRHWLDGKMICKEMYKNTGMQK